MNTLVYTEILDHSLSAKKILNSADPSNSIDLIYSITASVVDLNGGYIDGVAIGNTTPCTAIRTANLAVISSGNIKALITSSSNCGVFDLRNSSGTQTIYLHALTGVTSFFNISNIVFGASAFTSPAVNYEFRGSSRFTAYMYADGDIAAKSGGVYYVVGSNLARFNAMNLLTWTAMTGLTTNQVNYLKLIGNPISTTQWNYLAALNQSLATTQSPSFAGLTVGPGAITADEINAGDVNGDDIAASASISGAECHCGYLVMGERMIEETIELNPTAGVKFVAKITTNSYLSKIVKKIDFFAELDGALSGTLNLTLLGVPTGYLIEVHIVGKNIHPGGNLWGGLTFSFSDPPPALPVTRSMRFVGDPPSLAGYYVYDTLYTDPFGIRISAVSGGKTIFYNAISPGRLLIQGTITAFQPD